MFSQVETGAFLGDLSSKQGRLTEMKKPFSSDARRMCIRQIRKNG